MGPGAAVGVVVGSGVCGPVVQAASVSAEAPVAPARNLRRDTVIARNPTGAPPAENDESPEALLRGFLT